jgi:hypothetical protein
MAHDHSSPIDSAGDYNKNLEDDEENNQDETGQEEESPAVKDADGSPGCAPERAASQRRRPEQMPPLVIQNAILQSLQKCANHTCTLKSLTSRVLKELGVTTRGNPRLEFEKRVMRNVGALKRKGLIKEYKAKNKRIRLLAAAQETNLFE